MASWNFFFFFFLGFLLFISIVLFTFLQKKKTVLKGNIS